MNRPEFETQEEWRNGLPLGPWWREVDWPKCTAFGVCIFVVSVHAAITWGLV